MIVGMVQNDVALVDLERVDLRVVIDPCAEVEHRDVDLLVAE
jgi:hypothetical protein